MACLEIKNREGNTELIPENTPYSSDWKFTGRIDVSCKGVNFQTSGETIEEKLAKEGIQWGDAIAWATKKAGFEQCSACKARQEILNHVKENGWLNTIKALKGTF